MKNAKLYSVAVASLLALTLGSCSKQKAPEAPQPAAGNTPARSTAAAAEIPREIVFQQKVACSNAARAFGFTATSPREHPYLLRRNCYSEALNTCVVEYQAQDDSATIFDALTGDVLVEYLNYPGNADRINVAARIGTGAPPTTATTTAEEGVTPQRVDYERWSTHLFEGCAR